MAQKRLNHANIDILLEEVSGETVPQRVRRDVLLDPRGLGRGAPSSSGRSNAHTLMVELLAGMR